jgi:hypothetical protein
MHVSFQNKHNELNKSVNDIENAKMTAEKQMQFF